jgi:O-antigen/teichoic acid export membrane protein
MKFLSINFGDKKVLYQNSFLMLMAELVNKVIMFSLTIIITRYLGAEGYGQFAFAMGFTSLFFIFADFGISTLAVKEIARNNNIAKKYLDNFTALKLLLSLFTILLLCLVVPFLGKPFSIDLMVYLFGGYILISSTSEFMSSVFKAYEKMEYVALSIIIKGIVLFAFGSVFVFLDFGIYYIILAYILGALSSLFFLIYILRKKIIKFSTEFDFRFNIALLRRASPFALSLTFASIYLSIDSVLISHFIGDIEVGYYSLGYSLTIVFYAIPAIITNVYFPRMSLYFKSDKLKLRPLFRLLLIKLCIIAFPLIIFLYYISTPIFLLFYGSEFSGSIIVFQVLLLALLFKFFSFPYAFLLVAAEKQNIRVSIQGFTALFNLVTNIIFIPKYGILGAAGTTIASELLLVIMYYYFSRKALN